MVEFVRPADAQDEYFANYSREVEAMVEFVADTIKKGKTENVLVFGMPGSGKSAFPKRVQYVVNKEKKLQCGLLRLDCNEIAKKSDDELRFISDELYNARNLAQAWEAKGVIITLDELDTIAPDRAKASGDPRYTSLALKLMGYVSSNFDGCSRLVTLMITNYPTHLEQALIDRVNTSVYLPPIESDTSRNILAHFGVQQPKEVLEELHKFLGDHRYSLRGLSTACKKAKDAGGSLSSRPVDGVTRLIERYLPPVVLTRETIDEYEREHETLISQSRLFIDLMEV